MYALVMTICILLLKQIGVCRVLLYSLRGPCRARGPAASAVGARSPFLGRQEMEERTGQRGFPLCNSPTPEKDCTDLSARQILQCADGSQPARGTRAHHFVAGPLARNRAPPLSALSPFRSHARRCRLRRDGRGSLSVLPETRWRPTHSRSRSQAATSDYRASARRRTESRHAGGIPKGGALRRVFCPAFSA